MSRMKEKTRILGGIFIAFAFGCNIGASVLTAQLFGAKKYGEMKTAVLTSLIASCVTCILLIRMEKLYEDLLPYLES